MCGYLPRVLRYSRLDGKERREWVAKNEIAFWNFVAQQHLTLEKNVGGIVVEEFLKDFLEHRRLVHGTDDLDAVFDCVACQMLETQLARAERLEGGVAEPTVQ